MSVSGEGLGMQRLDEEDDISESGDASLPPVSALTAMLRLLIPPVPQSGGVTKDCGGAQQQQQQQQGISIGPHTRSFAYPSHRHL